MFYRANLSGSYQAVPRLPGVLVLHKHKPQLVEKTEVQKTEVETELKKTEVENTEVETEEEKTEVETEVEKTCSSSSHQTKGYDTQLVSQAHTKLKGKMFGMLAAEAETEVKTANL